MGGFTEGVLESPFSFYFFNGKSDFSNLMSMLLLVALKLQENAFFLTRAFLPTTNTAEPTRYLQYDIYYSILYLSSSYMSVFCFLIDAVINIFAGEDP